ncbi:MAG: hypothetical protein ABEJ24_06010 [Candidatus Magasanikbacteria bacterium]
MSLREKMIPARMNALLFTYIALAIFSLAPRLQYNPSILEIIVIPTVTTTFLNIWNWYKENEIFDERKIDVATNGMAWAYVAVTLTMLILVAISQKATVDGVRDILSLGLWTWMAYYSLENLYHKFGEEIL